MSDHHHHHDESKWPIIWEVRDFNGKRMTMLVAHTIPEATEIAKTAFGTKWFEIIDTGKRKPPNKCCNKCGDKPCGS